MKTLRALLGALVEQVQSWLLAARPRVRRLVGKDRFTASVQLDGYSCGAHCTLAVLRHFRKRVTFDELKDELGTDEDGTRPAQIVVALRRRGFRAWGRSQVTLIDLQRVLRRGGVAIAEVDGDHYLVVYGMSRDYVHVMDSIVVRAPTGRQTRKAFRRRWDRAAIFILPSSGE